MPILTNQRKRYSSICISYWQWLLHSEKSKYNVIGQNQTNELCGIVLSNCFTIYKLWVETMLEGMFAPWQTERCNFNIVRVKTPYFNDLLVIEWSRNKLKYKKTDVLCKHFIACYVAKKKDAQWVNAIVSFSPHSPS